QRGVEVARARWLSGVYGLYDHRVPTPAHPPASIIVAADRRRTGLAGARCGAPRCGRRPGQSPARTAAGNWRYTRSARAWYTRPRIEARPARDALAEGRSAPGGVSWLVLSSSRRIGPTRVRATRTAGAWATRSTWPASSRPTKTTNSWA